jgi:glucose-1-phosphate thymidylyltransferase
MKYGSIPAGGLGTRLQPIGFSKELAPVAGRAVIEYLIERMCLAGISNIFITAAEDKTDLIRYLATKSPYRDNLIFLVRERKGLFDGIAQPAQFLRDDDELFFGLPDTIWYPKSAFRKIDEQQGRLVLGLFETDTPERFDSVSIDDNNRISEIQVKVKNPKSSWTWGIGKFQVSEVPKLHNYAKNQKGIPLFGVAMNKYAVKNPAFAIQLAKSSYIDIGQPEEYRRAEDFVEKYEK